MFIRVTNVTLNKSYKIKGIDDFTIEQESPVTILKFPESGPTFDEIIKLEGSSMKFNLQFKIVEDTEDLSEGTGVSTVGTVLEQQKHLLDFFASSDAIDNFRLEMITPPSTVEFTRDGVITKDIITWKGGLVHTDGRLEMNVGNVI